MQHFVNTTKNKTVVMGRKTYDSIGHTLPNRKNLVLTYNNDLNLPGVTIYHDISKLINDHINEDLYVIGGKQIYEEFSKYADFYIVSYINNSYDCDIYMDKIDFSNFEIIKQDTTKPEFSIK
jgi:dihydrofolate reductase